MLKKSMYLTKGQNIKENRLTENYSTHDFQKFAFCLQSIIFCLNTFSPLNNHQTDARQCQHIALTEVIIRPICILECHSENRFLYARASVIQAFSAHHLYSFELCFGIFKRTRLCKFKTAGFRKSV